MKKEDRPESAQLEFLFIATIPILLSGALIMGLCSGALGLMWLLGVFIVLAVWTAVSPAK